MKICLPVGAATIIKRLESRGYEAWVVGGCVRDSLLGQTPHDWDICTSAHPEETCAVFQGFPVIETGLRHGTVTVLLDHVPFEVTSYRTEGVYSDGRHPDNVRFVRNLREDLARRDFTVNAMAYHPKRGLADFFGGRQDLDAKQIRCVGDADTRFSEDALRVLRALRFSATLDFSIEEKTAASLLRNRQQLSRIAVERIREELDRLLCGQGAEKILLDFFLVVCVFLPELAPTAGFDQHNPHHCFDVWEHTARAVVSAPPELAVRLALLLHDIGKPRCFTRDKKGVGHFYGHGVISGELAQKILRRLKYDNKTAKQVLELIQYHDTPIIPEERVVKRWLNRMGEEQLRRLLAVKCADALAQNPTFLPEKQTALRLLEEILEEILAQRKCFSLKDLAVNGRDLLDAGVPEGPEIGALLEKLLDAVVEERILNERDALLERAKMLTAMPKK